jgi:predicted RecA/RadA family phage recombinase
MVAGLSDNTAVTEERCENGEDGDAIFDGMFECTAVNEDPIEEGDTMVAGCSDNTVVTEERCENGEDGDAIFDGMFDCTAVNEDRIEEGDTTGAGLRCSSCICALFEALFRFSLSLATMPSKIDPLEIPLSFARLLNIGVPKPCSDA